MHRPLPLSWSRGWSQFRNHAFWNRPLAYPRFETNLSSVEHYHLISNPAPGKTLSKNQGETKVKQVLSQPEKKTWINYIPTFVAALFPVFLPLFHFFIFKILFVKPEVNALNCSCSCFDSVYKGPYEDGRVSHYKNVYFNSNTTTFKMWGLTVVAVVLLYETLEKFMQVVLIGKLRHTIGLLILISIYSHYFDWWVSWGYLNDDFGDYWNHQIIFSLSELITTYLAYRNIDRTRETEPYSMMSICGICLFHVVCSMKDQFIVNVLLGHGEFYKVIRDCLLLINDLFHIFISCYELKCFTQRNRSLPLSQLLCEAPFTLLSLAVVVNFGLSLMI